MFKKEGKLILSLYFIANALPRSIASRPTFDCVSSHVRSCLVPRSLKSIGTAAPTHYFRVFKIEYWQQRPRIEDMRWPAVIVCCGASTVAHFASKVSYSASPQAFAEGSCSVSLPTMIFWILNTLRKYTAFIPKRTLIIGKQHWGFQKSFTMSSTRGRA